MFGRSSTSYWFTGVDMVEKKDSFKARQIAASESSKYKSQDNIWINENQFSEDVSLCFTGSNYTSSL